MPEISEEERKQIEEWAAKQADPKDAEEQAILDTASKADTTGLIGYRHPVGPAANPHMPPMFGIGERGSRAVRGLRDEIGPDPDTQPGPVKIIKPGVNKATSQEPVVPEGGK